MNTNQYMGVVQYFLEHKNEFYWQVLFPIAVWMVLMLAMFIFLFFKYTVANWTTENPNPYEKETMGMPRGTFRGALTLTLLYITVILELVNVRIIGFEQEIREFLIAFQMMIAFYFGAKVMHHITSSDKQKALAFASETVQSEEQGYFSEGEYQQQKQQSDTEAVG